MRGITSRAVVSGSCRASEETYEERLTRDMINSLNSQRGNTGLSVLVMSENGSHWRGDKEEEEEEEELDETVHHVRLRRTNMSDCGRTIGVQVRKGCCLVCNRCQCFYAGGASSIRFQKSRS